MKRSPKNITRRNFLAGSAATLVGARLGSVLAVGAEAAAVRQAMGTKVGEVTDTTAIVWTRLTEAATRNSDGLLIPGKVKKGARDPVPVPVAQLEGACPGAAGRIRVRYGTREDLSDAKESAWTEVSEANDFSHQFALTGLKPGTVYHYSTETAAGGATHGAFRGKFTTAPAPNAPSELRFCVMTCQGYADRDHDDGHPIYPAMLALAPQFVALTGDNVYYDSDAPRVNSAELARYHWQRMFSLPRQMALLRNVSSYFEKDDHDTLSNDSWPGMRVGTLTFAEGQKIFREQVPIGESIYRTFRWGRDLQIWLTDGRDFRSPNKTPDGPEKTIWGAEQKAWFKRTVKESDATWKVLISPTPLVGPDRGNKNDNHANEGFQTEGDELRAWLQANVPENFFIVCGDRHWQYHSVHPKTAVREFACGPASDSHASGSPGLDPAYHKFHLVKGGFLSVTLQREGGTSVVVCEHRNVDGQVVHEWRGERKVAG